MVSSEVPSGKFTAGTAFQITLKGRSFLFIPKSDGGFDPPRAEFRSMRTFAPVMLLQPGRKIPSTANVMVVALLAFENINVKHIHSRHAKP